MDSNNHVLDKLYIKDLLIRCIVGIKKEEREKKQDVVINITLYSDLRRAADTDDIEKTVDYASIKKKVIKHVEKSSYFLIEALAEKIIKICFEDPLVKKVKVNVEKPGALRFARTVGVEIIRQRPA